jgi:hypothetical protein
VPNLIVSAVSTFDNKGLKKGQKEIGAFDKTLKSLGKTFAGVFGAQKLLQFSKNAVNAFMADEKAAKALELQLKNTGFAFSAPAVEYYIANLQKTTGVLDDQLRPAFQQLLTVTGSVTQSQDALSTALNISAATGKSLTEVSAALTRGFSGNTAGLSRLGAGISKATLKTGDMDKIMTELNQKFSGQAAARLDTYAGKMDLLKVGAENAKEEIGKGLLDALSALGNDQSIEKASTAMEGFGKSIGDAIFGLATLINKLDGLAKKTKTAGIADILLRLQPGGKGASILAGALSTYGNKERNKPTSNFTYDLGSSATKDIERANKLLKEKNKLEADAIAKLKAKSEVDKLKDKFDVERIGLMAALNLATDEETKLRIRAQLAILDNNEALAKKYNAELNAKTATDLLAAATYQAAAALTNFGPALFDALGNMTGRGKNQIAPFENYSYTVPQGATNQQAQAGTSNTPTVGVTVNAGTIVTDQQLEAVIQKNVLQLLKSGNKLLPAGSLTN